MITGSSEESRALMMNAAVRIIAQHGFEGFTTKKWAKEAGVAEGSLYYHFKSKNDLLNETFAWLDKMLDPYASNALSALEDLLKKNSETDVLAESWEAYCGFLINHPDYAIYYYRFRTSPRFTKEVRAEQRERLITGREKGIPEELMPVFVTVMALMVDLVTAFAYREVIGLHEGVDDSEKIVRYLLMNGVNGILKKFRDQMEPSSQT